MKAGPTPKYVEKKFLANGKEIVYLRGKLFWFKALGDPVPNYGKDGYEWPFDLSLDADGVKQAKALKVLNVKDKDDDRGQFLSFKQKVREGEGARPVDQQRIRVLDAAGKPWNPETKVGNGTVADVKFEIRDYGKGKYPGIYPRAVRILDLVEFNGGEFEALSEDDEYFAKAREAEDVFKTDNDEFRKDFGLRTASDADELDDDVPM